jgi:RNA polymerase sigma factor (sigma-70 family)
MDATDALVAVLKGEGPRVLATLARTIGDLAVAEDALSEATITALQAWPRTGVPDNPRAWLAVVARRKALDLLRRESARAAKETAAFRWGTGAVPDQIEEAIEVIEGIEGIEPESSLRDDMLRLIFTCCHPALGREAQVALSLRTLARLEVAAIARAFLVPEATMAKRLVRARAKIATARIPYAIPADTELPGRLASVLAVVYLVATEAHAPTGGDAVARVDLAAEATRLARLLAGLMPGEPEVLSLLALLLLTSARTPARTDADGNPVTLADQDRTRWNRAAIAGGSAWLAEAVARSGGVAGPYQLQAHLAAAHSTAPSWQETDWDRIVGLYDLLGSITANPVVALNRAVAVTERDGPEAGLAALKTIAGLEYSHLWHAALADNLRRLGHPSEAAGELQTAVTLAPSDAEQRLLQGRLNAVRPVLDGPAP